jgi:hypothetical protein
VQKRNTGQTQDKYVNNNCGTHALDASVQDKCRNNYLLVRHSVTAKAFVEVKTDIKYRTRRRNQIATLKCNTLKAKTEMLTFDKMHELLFVDK